LLLTLTEQENNVFVFPFRLAESRWAELKIGNNYKFYLEVSENGQVTLEDFEEVD
jgi:hypothetical protein